MLDWDEKADVLNVVREGFDLNALVNEDSERVPGFVKRIDPASGECVGFIVHSFSVRFPEEVSCMESHNTDRLLFMMDLSLKLTNEVASASFPKAA